jgi:Holliday junction DNA helicase RuvA
MIAILEGTVADKQDQSLTVICGGVGYEAFVTSETLGSLKGAETCRLYIYEYIREESHDLYGFTDREQKKFFQKLIGVNGVGPKMALSLMNLGRLDEVRQAIGSGNAAYLLRAGGVGRRLAERIIVDLKDAFAEAALMSHVGAKAQDDALQALISLGYSQAQAAEALARTDAKSTEDQIKQALKAMA